MIKLILLLYFRYYAVAIATQLCHYYSTRGKVSLPENVVFDADENDSTRFRKHLESAMLTNNPIFGETIREFGKIGLFPTKPANTRVSRTISTEFERFEIWCHCRTPWTEIYGSQIIMCDVCGQWFHQLCESVPEKVFCKGDQDKYDFVCSSCSK
jgi:hypothetical protein